MSTFQLNTAELEQLHELLLRFRLERLPSVELDTHVVQTAKAVRRRISRRHAGRDFVAPPRVRRPAAKAVHFGA